MSRKKAKKTENKVQKVGLGGDEGNRGIRNL